MNNKTIKFETTRTKDRPLRIFKIGAWWPFFWSGNIAASCFFGILLWYKKKWDEMDDDDKEVLYQHELCHYYQAKRDWYYYILYIISPRKRALYEIEAYIVSFKVSLELGIWKEYELLEFAEWVAELLSSSTYLWTCKKQWAYGKFMEIYATHK